MNFGDISLSQVLYFHFTTRQFSTGTPITASLLTVSVYTDDNTTQSTAGITTTFSSGFDGVAGLVSVKIDTSADGTFYAAGHDFSIVVTGGTSDGVSIIGEVVGYFSIQNRSALRPTTTGRTLDVAATGEAGLDFDNIKDATGAHTLTNITVPIVTTAANLTTNNDKTGYALTAAYDPAKTAAQAGDAMTLTVGERTSVGTAVWASATRTLTSFGTLAADTATAVWTSLTSALTTVGSIGKLLVDNINATITSRMATYTQPTGFLAATFPTTIASTTNITAGTITTVTNLTNAPTAGDFTTDMKTSLNAATPSVTVIDKTGFSLTAAYDPAKTAAQSGDAMTLTAGERISIGTAVWASATRTLSSFGSLVSDITTAVWGAAARTLTAFGFTVNTNTNSTETDIKAKTDQLTFTKPNEVDANMQSINDTEITGDGTPPDEFGV